MWIFGYGSLLWKVDFPYSEQLIGYISGYKRRFWQLSTDHRGIPEKPGRVVTLVPDPDETVWGVAYKIPSESCETVKSHLDHRERGGYSRVNVEFTPREKKIKPFTITLYIGSSDNPLYYPADDKEIAQVIHDSSGPSGSNTEYLLNLAEYVRKHIPEDKDNHLFELERLVMRQS